MITVRTILSDELVQKLNLLENFPDGDMLRAVALTMLPVVHDRIHVDGRDANGGQIGTYSPQYMKVRTGAFKSATITRGPAKGSARPNYNRSADTKVILSLTRQMENDFKVVAENDRYGLGFNNDENFNKSQYAEQTYRKPIYSLTEDEQNLAVEAAKEFVIRALSD